MGNHLNFSILHIHMLRNLHLVFMYMYERPLENIAHLSLYGRVLIEAHLFGSMEEYDYDHTLIGDSSAQRDKENCSVGEDNSNMCKGCCHKDGIAVVAS